MPPFTRKYPVVDYIYPGPQGATVKNWSFIPSRKDHLALTSLGFVVVVINGTGNPLRTKAFQDASYGQMAINTLPDQIAGIVNWPNVILLLILRESASGSIPEVVLLRSGPCLNTRISLKQGLLNPEIMTTGVTNPTGATDIMGF